MASAAEAGVDIEEVAQLSPEKSLNYKLIHAFQDFQVKDVALD